MSGLWEWLAGRRPGSQRQAALDGRTREPRPEKVPKAKTASSEKEVRALRSEVQHLRRELQGRLLQYHHQLGRLTKAVEAANHHGGAERRLSGRTLPQAPSDDASAEWQPFEGAASSPDPEGTEWRVLQSCPVCGSADRTMVSPWNKFIVTAKAPDEGAATYDYSVCHACGVLYAARRPVGSRYRFLLEHFGEATAKRGGTAEITNRVLNPYPLDDADRAELLRLAKPGIYVSDHAGLRTRDYLAPLLRERLENSVHVEIIGALVQPRRARVLEVRSRTGSILEGLRRAWEADVSAMPIWESQQFILREILDIPTSALIDFENFAIPFEQKFDVIVANHMFTHAIAPTAFFAELRRCLVPGGYIYLHGEPDDAEFLKGNQSMLATLNPLHMQAFDQGSLVRGLAANGFETVFVKGRNLQHLVLAKASDACSMTAMSPAECQARVNGYQDSFARAVVGVDESLRSRVAPYWSEALERTVAAGLAEYDERGQLRLVSR